MTGVPVTPDAATWRSWGIDPSWSRHLDVDAHDGQTHRWHLLDTGPVEDGITILCVHGNPTWAYAWATFLRRFAGRHRVIAVDQLGMGFSERAAPRTYVDRVADLADLVTALGLDSDADSSTASPLVLAAHDWGGAIAMGWAVDHPTRVAGMVLCNTGIAVPAGRGAPRIIRLAAAGPLRDLICRRTPTFVEGTVRLSGRRISRTDRAAFRAPYRRVADREAISDFVGDVPLRDDHPSAPDLADVAARLGSITAPVLLAWGARDIVFDDDFALDLAGRFPDSEIHRFPRANHLVMAEADVAGVVDTFLDSLDAPPTSQPPSAAGVATPNDSGLFEGLDERRHDDTLAIADLAGRTTMPFRQFVERVEAAAGELVRRGLQPGDRVAMLTPPGIDLLIAVYAVWRAGGVTVVADRGLGLRGLGRAVAAARPAWTIGPRRARVAATVLRWAPRAKHLDVEMLTGAPEFDVSGLAVPSRDHVAAILYTSGATGPAKGVRYTHGQLTAQRDALRRTYDITSDDRLVAAFAPFALYGPALGVPTALTDCDVTTPGELTAAALDDACRAIGATMAFASPAALANVVATGAGAGPFQCVGSLRLVMSAGAPVPVETLEAVARLAPDASIRTPYGMTEALPVSDVDLDAIRSAEAEHEAGAPGVCVGVPVEGAEVRVVALGFDALEGVPEPLEVGRTGELLVRAPWVSDGYLGRWQTQRLARPGDGWHRSGDVGHVDDSGRLWVEGRSVHVISTQDGPLAPVPLERAVERRLGPATMVTVGRVAAVGVGPVPIQQIVVVIERIAGEGHDDESGERDVDGVAGPRLTSAVRAAVHHPIAAVLVIDEMPVDIRHNAKIDRTAVSEWASGILS